MKKKRIALVIIPVMAFAVGAAYIGTNVAHAAQVKPASTSAADRETNDDATDPTNLDGDNPNE